LEPYSENISTGGAGKKRGEASEKNMYTQSADFCALELELAPVLE
jgi:hypothetical protein